MDIPHHQTLGERGLRWSVGIAAAGASILRTLAISDFAWRLGAAPEAIYFLIDLLLLISMIGMLVFLRALRNPAGILGLGLALTGILVIRTGPRLFDGAAYQLGAGLIVLGLAAAGARLVRESGLTRLTGLSWLASFLVTLGVVATQSPAVLSVATVLFCCGILLGGTAVVADTCP